MKKVDLVKLTQYVQVGHVYEHVYCRRVSEYMKSRNLYALLDYDMDARTYYAGIISLHITTYTEEALKAIENLLLIDGPISSDEVDGAMLQIFAEKRVDVEYVNKSVVDKELGRLSKMEWTRVDSLTETIQPQLVERDGIIYADTSEDNFGVITQRISSAVDDIPSQLIFAAVSEILAENLREIIPDAIFGFSKEDDFHKDHEGLTNENRYLVDLRHVQTLSVELESTKQLLQQMRESDFVDRLRGQLATALTSPYGLVSENIVRGVLGLVAGPRVWAGLAVEGTIRQVLNSMEISFQYNDTRHVLSVGKEIGF
jgi:hypothetical protein